MDIEAQQPYSNFVTVTRQFLATIRLNYGSTRPLKPDVQGEIKISVDRLSNFDEATEYPSAHRLTRIIAQLPMCVHANSVVSGFADGLRGGYDYLSGYLRGSFYCEVSHQSKQTFL